MDNKIAEFLQSYSMGHRCEFKRRASVLDLGGAALIDVCNRHVENYRALLTSAFVRAKSARRIASIRFFPNTKYRH